MPAFSRIGSTFHHDLPVKRRIAMAAATRARYCWPAKSDLGMAASGEEMKTWLQLFFCLARFLSCRSEEETPCYRKCIVNQ